MNDSRLTRLEELYGPLPMNKKDVKEEVERDEPPRYVQKRPLPQVPPPSSAKKAKSERLISFSEYGSGIYLFIYKNHQFSVSRPIST